MAFDEQTAGRVRTLLASEPRISERRMMGALVFMLGDHMACGVNGTSLMVRVGATGYADALGRPHGRPMEMGNGRVMNGFVRIDAEGFSDDSALLAWLDVAKLHISTLPGKKR